MPDDGNGQNIFLRCFDDIGKKIINAPGTVASRKEECFFCFPGCLGQHAVLFMLVSFLDYRRSSSKPQLVLRNVAADTLIFLSRITVTRKVRE
jgi:hypothetical protein